jgi:hypothetical protein
MSTAEILKLVRSADNFVVWDYTTVCQEAPDPTVAVVPADALFEVIEKAHREKQPITISPVGPPIIDWSSTGGKPHV